VTYFVTQSLQTRRNGSFGLIIAKFVGTGVLSKRCFIMCIYDSPGETLLAISLSDRLGCLVGVSPSRMCQGVRNRRYDDTCYRLPISSRSNGIPCVPMILEPLPKRTIEASDLKEGVLWDSYEGMCICSLSAHGAWIDSQARPDYQEG